MLSAGLYRTLLWCYPAPFRHEYGSELLAAFTEQMREARQQGGWLSATLVCVQTIFDLFITATKEHCHVTRLDLRYAFRTLASQLGFTTVAILSLALGIGANTAIFSLLNSVLLNSLPVHEPQSLVMLTNPGSSGVSEGSQGGERSLLSYPEFQRLRDGSGVFSNVMACQSQLERVQARVEVGEPEEIRYRMVSEEYFSTLGVSPLLGQPFTHYRSLAAPSAVISYDYWKRRFGGSTDIVGKKIAIHQRVFLIVGVTSKSFFGETVGERPDMWLPLSMQPTILPGRDWLHDKTGSFEKTMWLHVFGRLKPGITIEQAQAAANVVFRQELRAFYGSGLTPQKAKEFFNQQLKVRSAAMGASQLRGQVAEPLKLLLAAAALVLLIGCANLGNLLLARSTARTREVSVRLALGASRPQLIRQLLTESLIIAFLGGIAGLAAAWALRIGLLYLFSDSAHFPATPSIRVLGFAFSLTLAAGLILGLLPVLRTLGINPATGLKEQGRGMTGSVAWLRAGKAVVAGQLALSLSLLVGAGLLVRTLYNLQQVNIGYEKEHLMTLEIDALSAGYKGPGQLQLFEQLLEKIGSVPGIRAATYSNNGLFTGSDSGDQVEVQGYSPQSNVDRNSRYEHVGPNYFSALGVPLLFGREIKKQDRGPGHKVCVINEAFAKQFFKGRNPLGMHLTQVFGNDRNTFEIVGVARDSRANKLRGNVEHRYYVPAAQPIFALDSAVFEIRTAADPASAVNGIRHAILSWNPNLTITNARALGVAINERIAQDRLLARMSTVFGVVALLLAAVGLYGVLSYGVARRTSEIGIRKALGATHRAVITMILRETGWILLAGLLAGIALSAAIVRLISSRLYGMEPADPLTLGVAVALLAAVAVAAAWIPAYRASRVDPLIALRYE